MSDVIVTDPTGWKKTDRHRPRNVVEISDDGLRFMHAANLEEAEIVQHHWRSAFYLTYPGEFRPFQRGIP